MHLLVDPGEWEIAMGPGGALEAFIEAKEQGTASYRREDKPGSFYHIPVTPHKLLLCKDHHQLCTLFIFMTK